MEKSKTKALKRLDARIVDVLYEVNELAQTPKITHFIRKEWSVFYIDYLTRDFSGLPIRFRVEFVDLDSEFNKSISKFSGYYFKRLKEVKTFINK